MLAQPVVYNLLLLGTTGDERTSTNGSHPNFCLGDRETFNATHFVGKLLQPIANLFAGCSPLVTTDARTEFRGHSGPGTLTVAGTQKCPSRPSTKLVHKTPGKTYATKTEWFT